MARPPKHGLDYFPLDVDIEQDDAVQVLEAEFGMEGFGILMRLYAHIYRRGYHVEWTDRARSVFAKKACAVDPKKVDAVVSLCVEEGLFSKEHYDEHAVLTSRAIQLRFLEATRRRKKVTMLQEHVCEGVNVSDYPHCDVVNGSRNGTSGGVNGPGKPPK